MAERLPHDLIRKIVDSVPPVTCAVAYFEVFVLCPRIGQRTGTSFVRINNRGAHGTPERHNASTIVHMLKKSRYYHMVGDDFLFPNMHLSIAAQTFRELLLVQGRKHLNASYREATCDVDTTVLPCSFTDALRMQLCVTRTMPTATPAVSWAWIHACNTHTPADHDDDSDTVGA